MRSVRRWRHYCDFCRRGMFYRPRMEKHERGCTANLNRVCGVCVYAGSSQQPMPVLLAELTFNGYKALREKAGNCPACILATIRCATAGLDPESRYGSANGVWRDDADAFDYKAEMKSLWNDVDEAKSEACHEY